MFPTSKIQLQSGQESLSSQQCSNPVIISVNQSEVRSPQNTVNTEASTSTHTNAGTIPIRIGEHVQGNLTQHYYLDSSKNRERPVIIEKLVTNNCTMENIECTGQGSLIGGHYAGDLTQYFHSEVRPKNVASSKYDHGSSSDNDGSSKHNIHTFKNIKSTGPGASFGCTFGGASKKHSDKKKRSNGSSDNDASSKHNTHTFKNIKSTGPGASFGCTYGGNHLQRF